MSKVDVTFFYHEEKQNPQQKHKKKLEQKSYSTVHATHQAWRASRPSGDLHQGLRARTYIPEVSAAGTVYVRKSFYF